MVRNCPECVSCAICVRRRERIATSVTPDADSTAPTEKVARAPVDSCTAAEKDASAPAAARLRKQRRKYVALCTRDEVLLQAVAKEPTRPGYRLVEAVFDSGAEESVSPPRFFPGPVVPSTMSKAGGSYRVANGHRVPNIGQQAVHFETDERQAAGIIFQTAEIERPLISASGNEFVTDQNKLIVLFIKFIIY